MPTWAVHCSQPPRAVAGASASACPCQRATREGGCSQWLGNRTVVHLVHVRRQPARPQRCPRRATHAECVEPHELHGRLGNAGQGLILTRRVCVFCSNSLSIYPHQTYQDARGCIVKRNSPRRENALSTPSRPAPQDRLRHALCISPPRRSDGDGASFAGVTAALAAPAPLQSALQWRWLRGQAAAPAAPWRLDGGDDA